MKKLLFILTLLFALAGFSGAICVLRSGGQMNAGYAVVPMLFSLACAQGVIALKRKDRSID